MASLISLVFTGNIRSVGAWNTMKDVNASDLTYLQVILQPCSNPLFTYYGYSGYLVSMSNKGIEFEYKELSNLMTTIILSNNSFFGDSKMNNQLANEKGFENSNLSNNNLQGHIPSSLDNLKALESLDLSCNNLSGQIPQHLKELAALECLMCHII